VEGIIELALRLAFECGLLTLLFEELDEVLFRLELGAELRHMVRVRVLLVAELHSF